MPEHKVTVKELWENTKAPAGLPPSGEPHPADDAYAVPVSTVKLPSRGLAYPSENPLYLAESVDVKPVTAREENILASPVLIRNGKVLTTLMRACITNRLVDPDDMLLGDKNAVLIAIRVSAYGAKYEARVSCPECREEADHEFDISRLSLKVLEAQPDGGPGSNEFKFLLPLSKRACWFRLMDVRTNAQLEKDKEAVRKKTGQDQAITMRLLAQVTRIQGVEQGKPLVQAIENMPGQDSLALRRYMDDIAPDVNMEQPYECGSCGQTSEVEIPLGLGFFWPSRA